LRLHELFEAEFSDSPVHKVNFPNTGNYVYHGSSAKNAISMLKNNVILDRTIHDIDGKKVSGVSTSRNKNFSHKWGEVIFALDMDKIKNTKKVVPVDFVDKNPHYKLKRRDNSEEFIIGPLTDLSKYLSFVMLRNDIQRNPSYHVLEDLLYGLDIQVIFT